LTTTNKNTHYKFPQPNKMGEVRGPRTGKYNTRPDGSKNRGYWNLGLLFMTHFIPFLMGIAVVIFVLQYNSNILKNLEVNKNELNTFTMNWQNSDDDCIMMWNQLVAIGVACGGALALSSFLGICAMCLRPCRKCLHSTATFFSCFICLVIIGWGVALYTTGKNGNILFDTGVKTSCLPHVSGSLTNNEMGVPTNPDGKVAMSYYCNVQMHPKLYLSWPEACPQNYAPAQKQLDTLLASNISQADARKFHMNKYAECKTTGVCDGCMEQGKKCRKAIESTVTETQQSDGTFMIVIGCVGFLWVLVFSGWTYNDAMKSGYGKNNSKKNSKQDLEAQDDDEEDDSEEEQQPIVKKKKSKGRM